MSSATILPPQRVTIVGVLNATPDSFSDGGRFLEGASGPDVAAALEAARRMVADGAHWIDVGGESTRPGAEPVSAEEEIRRTCPIVKALAKELDVPISIDTRKAAVADAALEAGATIVNDVSGLADDEVGACAARHEAGLVIGHLRGEPSTMQEQVSFVKVVHEVGAELRSSADRALELGVAPERIAIDPGIGFGKELEHNLALLARAGELRESVGFPVLIGASRKSFLGRLTGDAVEDRDGASHAACAVAVFAGADGVRVHDVAGARRAVQVAEALRKAQRDAP